MRRTNNLENDMCKKNTRVIIGTAAICFSGGILAAYVLPGFVIAFIESAVLLAAGVILIKK